MLGTIDLRRMPEGSAELQSQTRKHKYCLTGIFNEVSAMDYCAASIPLLLPAEGLFRQNISLSTPGGDLFYAEASYGPIPKIVGEWSISGSTTGGTVHRNYSLQCVHAYHIKDGDVLDEPGLDDVGSLAIGLRDDMIEGTEVVVPTGQRTYTLRYAKGTITEAYMDYLESLTGIVNSQPWHGRPAGEVLFMGCPNYSTSASGSSECSVAFQFAFSKNMYRQTLGEFENVINKDGHDLLDVIFAAKTDSRHKPNASPDVIRIHRIYPRLPFLTYLGF